MRNYQKKFDTVNDEIRYLEPLGKRYKKVAHTIMKANTTTNGLMRNTALLILLQINQLKDRTDIVTTCNNEFATVT